MLLAAGWSLCFAFMQLIKEPTYFYWLNVIEYVWVALIGPTWFVLVLQWTGRDRYFGKKGFVLLYLIPVATLMLAFTNTYHNLFWVNVKFTTYKSALRMIPTYGPAWWMLTIFSYMVISLGIFLVARALLSLRHIYRKQAVVILIGTLAPLIVNIIYNLIPDFFLYTDITPTFFIVTGIAYAWGFSQLKLMEIIPVAKDAVFGSLKDPILVVDLQDRIIDATPSAFEIFDTEGTGLIGEKIGKILSKRSTLLNAIKDKKEKRIEISLDVNGSRRYYDMQVDTLYNRCGTVMGYILSMRDITERKEAELQLRKAQRGLQELNKRLEEKVLERTARIEELLRRKDAFLSHLGHDLRTPLTPILGLLPILIDREKDAKQKDMLEILHRNVNYLKKLVDETIELAEVNLSSGSNPEDVDLSELVRDVLKGKKKILMEKNLKLINNLRKGLVVKANKALLKRLIENLLDNSCKYTPSGGNISISAEEDEKTITVVIKDSGIGMTREEIEHVFDEFYKADLSRHDLASLGIGLAICKRIMEQLGGKIRAESPGPGKGSTFYLTLPRSNKKKKRDVKGSSESTKNEEI